MQCAFWKKKKKLHICLRSRLCNYFSISKCVQTLLPHRRAPELTGFCSNRPYKTPSKILLDDSLHFIDILRESWQEDSLQ